ncbi:MAG: DM13 domain-containing protein [Candidatus Pacearchaeota archaeon]
MNADAVHKVSGEAKVISQDNKKYLRFENFQSTNGPDLYVYLSTDEGAGDFVNLGELKGNFENQNYELPKEIGLEKYENVLIWCQAFSVLFGSAEI